MTFAEEGGEGRHRTRRCWGRDGKHKVRFMRQDGVEEEWPATTSGSKLLRRCCPDAKGSWGLAAAMRRRWSRPLARPRQLEGATSDR